jgi:hypothetical protein
MSQETTTYEMNFLALKGAKDKLAAGEPNVDLLVPICDLASKSYKACIERIDQVEALLGYTKTEQPTE